MSVPQHQLLRLLCDEDLVLTHHGLDQSEAGGWSWGIASLWPCSLHQHRHYNGASFHDFQVEPVMERRERAGDTMADLICTKSSNTFFQMVG